MMTAALEAANIFNDKKIDKIKSLYKVNKDMIDALTAPMQLKFKYHYGETLNRLGAKS